MFDAISPKVKSVENMVKRAREKTKTTPSSACPVCHVELWISFFFDGTGNHRERDFPNCHSNVAALFDAHRDEPENGITRLYYEGLGRAFEFKDRYEEIPVYTSYGSLKTTSKEGYEESDDRALGKGFADGITERLEKAIFDFTRTVEDWKALRKVDAINVSVFGFSRGATEARAFLHWLAALSKIKIAGNKLTYDGIPLRVKFLGVFDTVESVGWAAANKMPETIKTAVPSFVENCTHIVAAHELRHAFPLTLIERKHRCVVYPGAHSDIGGGYAPDEQGRGNGLARVALVQMLDEARAAGLKMMSIGEMKQHRNWSLLFQPSFGIHSKADKSLKAYLSEVKPAGAIESHINTHMNEYWQWLDSGQAITDVNRKLEQWRGNSKVEKALKTMKLLLTFEARTQQGKGYKPATGLQNMASHHLFSNYVHDSFEHFSATGGTLQTDLSDADYYKPRALLAPTK
ncbi:MAG: DUF2235 domain-containing protein [Propionivibrio sp.]|nr:DUF2235 domain-containing protein [Propionivibrio sp.]MBP7525199.1 DUF2235 domain-containing protein [Propionivibrio sp.]MBP8163063.1 DUF2235 domain-containing protein [Propionivibrio sp.]